MSDAAKEAREIAVKIEACLDEVGYSIAGGGEDLALAFDIIASEIEPLIRERDEWKAKWDEIRRERDGLGLENAGLKAALKMLA